jgi:two-component system, NarL family, response regulator
MTIKVLIAEDLTMLAEVMTQVIDLEADMEVIGHAQNGFEAITLYNQLKPDIVIMDIAMPVMDGVESISAIKSMDESAKILILTALGGEESAYRGLRSGANGFLFKGERLFELLEAIRTVASGTKYFSTVIAAKIADRNIHETLSEREIQVLTSIASYSTQETASRLNLSTHTVHWHIQKILHKLGLKNRTQAVDKARQQGLLSF